LKHQGGKAKAEFVKKIHEKVKTQIEKKVKSYAKHANKGSRKVVFEPGDWVWVHFRKERFPSQRKSKLMPRGDGPFQVLAKINDNAYKIDLPVSIMLVIPLMCLIFLYMMQTMSLEV